MNTDGHYGLKATGDKRQIAALTCRHCPLLVFLREYRRPGDRSGQGRYNRARGVMVKHLHEKHRDAMASNAGAAQPPTDPVSQGEKKP